MQKIQEIPTKKLKYGAYAVRAEVDDEGIDELAASIRRIGIIVPLVVYPEGDWFIVIAGHRRMLAAKRADLQEVPVLVREDKQETETEVSLAENLFRKDLTPIEQAAAMKDIICDGVMEASELARAMHRSENWVQAQMAMLDWPDDVLYAIHQGWLSVSAASNIAMVQDEAYRNFLLSNARDSGATARTTAAWLQAWRAQQPAEQAVQAEPIPGSQPSTPALPQAPCIVCGNVLRTDALAHVLVCTTCINTIRGASVQG